MGEAWREVGVVRGGGVDVIIIYLKLALSNGCSCVSRPFPRGRSDGSFNEGRFSGKLMVTKINTESEYNSNLQIGME